MLYILLAILSGVSVVLSRIVNFKLAEEIGTFQGTFFNYLTGFLTSLIFFFLTKDYININNLNELSIPFYAYLGGTIGILVVLLFNYITPKVSSFSLSLLVFIGQLSIGIIIDYFSSNIISIGKILGGLLILLGLSYNIFIDKKAQETKSLNIIK
ncbi:MULTISPECIES: DMT family transporter [unclassified Clostridium]|uniref:DMT family transporter n=1 Tax=unclassified Clostridium TaxID=2614128 RepID=UPI00189793A5|nr:MULTISPECIES: DMT family transporter [unclassified Clostridium]MCR1952334.1 DMT family transporter [Clostridium sp. DSM 100503]